MAFPTKWLYNDPTMDFHDGSCLCPHHCRNCRYRLEGRQRLYCSEYCGRVWRAELELDERLRAATVPLPKMP